MKNLILFFAMVTSLSAQTYNPKFIKASGEYYYGTGISNTTTEARDRALAELTGQIAIRVASDFEHVIRDTGDGITEDVKSILKTHSAATLKNVTMRTKPLGNGKVEVFCYIHKNEVQKIFDERKQLIADIAKKAAQHENDKNVAAALKLNYFAMLLANSLPDQKVLYNGINYTVDLPARINRMIQGTSFFLRDDKTISDKEREITLAITYRGQPVSSLEFTFWDGSNQILVTGKDGLATFRLLGASTEFESLKLNIKYTFYESRNEYSIVGDLWELVKHPAFKNEKNLNLNPGETEISAEVVSLNKKWKFDYEFEGADAPVNSITKSSMEFLDAISGKSIEKINATYANDAFLRDKLASYMKFNAPSVLDNTISSEIAQTQNGYEMRRIRMLHTYPSIHKQSTEYLVLDFSPDGTLTDFNVSISQNMYEDFKRKSQGKIDRENRREIIKFVEKYRTAYLTRDIETVDMMFAEDALIIIGRRIERKKLSTDTVKYEALGGQPEYEYIRLSKQNYLRRQKNIFNSQKDVFLNFSTLDINRKNNAKSVYGVEMRQSYHSTTYADEGHLFLMIDFEAKDPLIYVRAWQPNEWSEQSLIKLGNFRVHK